MADKEGMNPMVQQDAMTPTDPLGALGSILGSNYGSAMEGPTQGPAVVPAEQGMGEATVSHPRQRKMSLLGKLADGFIAMGGGKPVFRKKFEDELVTEAMDGFTDDPIGAMKRLARLRGHGSDAWNMYNQYSDNQRQDSVAERQKQMADFAIQKYHQGMIASMYGAANEKNWSQMAPFIKKYVADNHVQLPFEISDQYDPEAANLMFTSGIKPKDQVGIEQKDRSLDQGDVRLEQGQARIDQGDTRLEDNRNYRGQVMGERVRHNKTMEARPTGKPQAKNMEIKDSQGKSRLVTFSPDGTRAASLVNGKMIKYLVVNGKLIVQK